MSQPTSTDRFATHVAKVTFDDLDPTTVAKTKTFLLDSIGVGIAGSSGTALTDLKAMVGRWGAGDEATVWVTGERLPAQSAALLNAYQIHCLEFDCVHEGAVVHPMATILSALAAYAERRAGEQQPLSGRDLLLGLVVGVDIAALIGIAATGPVRFFRPATAGGIGAAAALARLDGLDADGIKNTMGAMYGQTCGTMQAHREGSPILGLQIGFNARGSLAALDLARSGLRCPQDIVDGMYGYLRLIENGDFDLAPVWQRLGSEWQITQVAHKPFPSGRLTHGVIDALMRLQEAHGFAREDVAGIHGRVPPLVYKLVSRPDQPAPEANYAKLCLAYVAGVYLAHGTVDIPHFKSQDMLRDSGVHEFASRITLELDDNPDENALDPQQFHVTLRDGTVHDITLDHVFGHPERPLTQAQNEEKFIRCCGHAIRPLRQQAIDAILGFVADLENQADAGRLARLTVPPG